MLGKGASATVYRAELTLDGAAKTTRQVAVKVGHGPAERARLADEAEVFALIDSTGMPELVDAGVLPESHESLAGLPYIALDWSGELAVDPSSIRDEERTATALAVARDVGDALAALHAMGLAHGDVKPSNVVVRDGTEGARARLIDLGLHAASTEAIPVGGTRRYLAPEALSAGGEGDARGRDLWALGMTLAEIGGSELRERSEPAERRGSGRDSEPRGPGPRDKTSLEPALHAVVRELLSVVPGRRPSAEWVSAQARRALGQAASPHAEDGERLVRRAYVAVRRGELLRACRSEEVRVSVRGTPGAWLAAKVALLSRVSLLRGASRRPVRATLDDLDTLGKARFLTAIAGRAATQWPLPAALTDDALVERVLRLARHEDPRALTFAALSTDTPEQGASVPDDALGLGLALVSASPSPLVLDAAERWVAANDAPAALLLALGRALRLAGHHGRALAVLERVKGPEARAEAAECARRAGDRAAAKALASEVTEGAGSPSHSRAVATRARLVLDEGDAAQAILHLDGVSDSPATLEVRALAEASRGNLETAMQLSLRGLALARTEEEIARLEGVLGNVAHAAGDAKRSLDSFRRAEEHAVRAGAVVEEATYLTGVAAAGFDAGHLGDTLEAATRATLLFEHLGKPRETARALLSRAAAYAAAGAAVQAQDTADLAADRARVAGDVRCRAFAHLVHADVRASDDPDALEHARRAAGLLERANAGDRLYAAARLLRRGGDVATDLHDALADDGAVPVPSRLDWWGARASVLSREASPVRPDRVLGALTALAALTGPVPGRGEAFAAGAALAVRAGDGEAARRFSLIAAEASRTLIAGAPPELRIGVEGLPWVRALRAPRESDLSKDQLGDVETLVRALSTRDRLRPLLDQVLDALVLWTGVERGLLLLRAPGGKLVPRAARNLARADLHGVQLSLSRSLAERALATGEPVVAVDAAGELPEVHQSVHLLKLRSVLAVPLLARGEALGVVYLDDRVRRGAFGPGELAWVRLVSALAAVAIADARDQLALRRAARRAKRAEARLEVVLARKTAELDAAERELSRARGERGTRYSYDAIIGESPKIRSLLAMVDRVTDADVPVLIAGESGSGKELVARAIHDNGPRSDGAFVSENCAAIPETLLETTLFGHTRGAFTGANRSHAGLFEVADGGTLFLDEIGEMSLAMQTKFLRILENGEVRPVGSERSRKVDVRVIAASHRDLAIMVAAGKFRQDLYYRLNVILIDVPPLRERPGDVEILARHLVERHGGKKGVRLTRAAIDALSAYSWPGNVRQLENEIRRAVVLGGEAILVEHLSAEVRKGAETELSRADGLNVRRRVDALEAELVKSALERTRGNQTRAAELLGLSRFGLQKMIRRLDIAIPGTEAGRDEPRAVTGPR